MKLQNALLQLDKGSPELQAVEAGEIDAIIDYSSSNVILFPAARRALRGVNPPPAANRDAVANGLLAELPLTEYRRLLAELEPVTLRCGNVLYEPGATIPFAYFPIDCAVALQTVSDDERAVGVALVGYEGMIGIPLVLGVDTADVRARVQATGTAMRIRPAAFRRLFRQCPLFQRKVYHYTHATLVLARQNGTCVSFHAAEARLARWFLLTTDRVMSDSFFLTQAFLAEMLGVRRVTVTEAACRLQHRNLISYRRGKVRILDRRGLEAAACRCYSKIESLRDTA